MLKNKKVVHFCQTKDGESRVRNYHMVSRCHMLYYLDLFAGFTVNLEG